MYFYYCATFTVTKIPLSPNSWLDTKSNNCFLETSFRAFFINLLAKYLKVLGLNNAWLNSFVPLKRKIFSIRWYHWAHTDLSCPEPRCFGLSRLSRWVYPVSGALVPDRIATASIPVDPFLLAATFAAYCSEALRYFKLRLFSFLLT